MFFNLASRKFLMVRFERKAKHINSAISYLKVIISADLLVNYVTVKLFVRNELYGYIFLLRVNH